MTNILAHAAKHAPTTKENVSETAFSNSQSQTGLTADLFYTEYTYLSTHITQKFYHQALKP